MSKSGPESQPSPVAPEAERPEAERPESESQKAASKVAHETDSRRRHVRLSMPLQVTIDGKIYDVVDWSLSGMQVANVEGMPGVGSRFVADVAVPFSDFNFALKVSCEIVWFDLEKMRIGCRFIDLRESQISLLRYLVDAFVSGRIATVDGLLHTSGSAPGSRRGAETPGIGDQEVSRVRRYWETAKRGSVYGLFLALGLAIAAFAGISIYNRLFAVTTDLGWVHATMVPVRATGEGMVEGVPPGPNTGIKRFLAPHDLEVKLWDPVQPARASNGADDRLGRHDVALVDEDRCKVAVQREEPARMMQQQKLPVHAKPGQRVVARCPRDTEVHAAGAAGLAVVDHRDVLGRVQGGPFWLVGTADDRLPASFSIGCGRPRA